LLALSHRLSMLEKSHPDFERLANGMAALLLGARSSNALGADIALGINRAHPNFNMLTAL